MSNLANIRIHSKSINIIGSPEGMDLRAIQTEEGDRIARVSYGETKKGVYVKFVQPSMVFNETGEKILVELNSRQFTEWQKFFQHLETRMPEAWANSTKCFISPLKEEGDKQYLQVKIVKPDTWSPKLECASVSFSMFAWRFGENAGVSLNLFPPSTRKSGSKRPRTEDDASKDASDK